MLGDGIAAEARRTADARPGDATGSPTDTRPGDATGSPTDTRLGDAADTRPGDAGEAADPIDARARELLDELTLHEKLHLLSGDTPPVSGLIGLVLQAGGRDALRQVPRSGNTGTRARPAT